MNWSTFLNFGGGLIVAGIFLGLVGVCWAGWRMFGRALGSLVGGRVAGGMASRLRRMTTGAAWMSGFSGTMASSDTLSGYATIIGYSSSRLMTTQTAAAAMRGAMAGELMLLVLLFIMIAQPQNTFMIAVTIFVVGFLAILLNWRGGKRYKSGRTLMGLGLLAASTYALQLLSLPAGIYTSLTALFAGLMPYTWDSLYSQILGLFVGVILTAVWKSSFLTILVAMATWGYVGLPMVLGVAVGSHLGLIFPLATMATNAGSSARRATVQHLATLIVAAVLMVVLNFFVMEYTVLTFWNGTLLVVLDAVAMIVIATPIAALATRWLSKPIAAVIPNSRPEQRLKIFSNVHRPEPALSLVAASVEVANHTRRVYKMISFLRDSLLETDSAKRDELYSRIRKYEVITRRVKDEILLYTYSAESTTPSGENLPTVRIIFNRIIAIERIALTATQMARTLEATDTSGRPLSDDQRAALGEVILSLQKVMFEVIDAMEAEVPLSEGITERGAQAEQLAHKYAALYYPYHQVEMIDLMIGCKTLSRIVLTLGV